MKFKEGGMNILSIDPGTHTGWSLRTDYIHSGVQTFTSARDESPGMRFLKFTGWLCTMNEQALLVTGKPIQVIYHERPHHRGGAATALLEGMVAHLQAFASQINAEIKAIPSGTLKKFATGKGNASKPEMIQAAQERYGLQTNSDDIADARHLLALAEKELGIKRSVETEE